MDRISEIMEQIESFSGESLVLGRGDSRMVGALQDIIYEDENIGGMIRGVHAGTKGILICTNQRFLFLGHDIVSFTGIKEVSYEYGDITSIEYQKGLIYGKLVIDIHGTKKTIHQILNFQVKGFFDYVTKHSEDRL